MGNNPSTPQAPPGSSRSSRSSPRTRTVPLPSTSADTRPHSTRRRKPSIELPDVAPVQAHPPPRRKGSDRPPVVDEEPDPDPPEGPGGSLRGALQGKAEHVVYGPRREDDDAVAVLSSPPALLPTPTASASAPKPAAAMAIPGAGPRAPGLRTPGGGGPGLRDGSLTNAGMGAIGASPLMDPDDTTHPGFGASARLTSAVLMSTDRMPVVGSPPRESPPNDSPFAQRAGKNEVPQPVSDSRDHATSASSGAAGEPRRVVPSPQTSFAGAVSSILAHAPGDPGTGAVPLPLPTDAELPPPHTASPSPPSAQPADTVLAPVVPAHALPLASSQIPSGTSVFASPQASRGTTPTGAIPSPAVLLPPAVFNAPVAAIPIPLLSVPSQTIAQSLIAAAVDLGAGPDGVPTLIKWKNEDGQAPAEGGKPARGPSEVFVTGTFAKGWKTKIELRKTDPSDFSALISLPPGPHRLKFIVDNEWKASKHLPVATDADGNLINYLQVSPVNNKIPVTVWAPPPGAQAEATASAATTGVPVPTAVPTTTPVPTSVAAATAAPSKAYVAGGVGFNGVYWPVGPDEEDPSATAASGTGSGFSGAGGEDDDAQWTQEIPAELVAWGEWEAARDEIECAFYAQHPNGPGPDTPPPEFPPPPASAGVQPPTLPAQLEKGPLNHAAYVTQGSGDDNSILPKPDHSVINHLAASPIKGGFLSVGVTTRYKRKFVTIVYYKALNR
ncbi:hypothetical protein JCM3770_001916 [Rhodotorula araucariae]